MGVEDEVKVLKRIPLFSNIDSAKLKLMAFASERLSFTPGQYLCKQGDVGDAAFIIIDGDADVVLENGGEGLTVASVGKNDIVGEIAILIDVPRTASIVATSDLVALKLTKELFFRMVRDFPDMSVEIMRALAHRLESANARLRKQNG
jgi:CRP-like cAMP-binding protein